ncbi:MAG: TIGR01212 family radical SAM protein [Clostridia bacterium]|nr:TIGR01212 family radical SAM protein [Clostridia bacterium]
MDRYRIYSKHLIERYGEKVYKVPVNLPGTCPNRDGAVSHGGCTFCDEEGSGFECLANTLSIQEQIRKNQAFFRERFGANKFIVYFQAFTNTYKPYAQFIEEVERAANEEDIIGISLSTRPDCINDRYLDFLCQLKTKKKLEVDIELGLQSVNYHTLSRLNRGHTLAEFLDAVIRIKKRDIRICAHIILNLPGDTELDVVENAKIVSALGIDYVKLHSLYIVEKTLLGSQYLDKEFTIISLEEYVARVVTFLAHLHPDVVVQRLVGKGPKGKLLFSNWDTSWWKIKELIETRLEEGDTYQGKNCNYLNGKALRHLEEGFDLQIEEQPDGKIRTI